MESDTITTQRTLLRRSVEYYEDQLSANYYDTKTAPRVLLNLGRIYSTIDMPEYALRSYHRCILIASGHSLQKACKMRGKHTS